MLNCKFWVVFSALVIGSSLGVFLPEQVRRPPTINVQPPRIKNAVPGNQITMNCSAEGWPPVQGFYGYTWKKDGKVLKVVQWGGVGATNNSAIIAMSDRDGSITFVGSELLKEKESELLKHEGEYQCYATNQWGTASSQRIKLSIGTVAKYNPPADKIVIVKDGYPQQIPCRNDDVVEQEIKWNFIPENVQLSQRIAMSLDGELIFTNLIRGDDDGLIVYCTIKYMATRSYKDGPHYTLKFDKSRPLRMSKPKIIYPKESTVIALSGKTFKLQCIANGKPSSEIRWDRLYKNMTDYSLVDFNRTLVIDNISYRHAGQYRCRASNFRGGDFKIVTVIVEAAPYFENESQRPTDILLVPGQGTTIMCSPKGKPKPAVEWYFNGARIFGNETDMIDRRSVTEESIVLRNLKENDTGVYHCMVTNVHGEAMASGFVNVLTSPPIALKQDRTLYQNILGESVTLSCNVFAFPEANYTWTKNGINPNDLDKNRLAVNADFSLSIKDLKYSDVGEYTCVSVNEYGSNFVTANVDVLTPTKIKVEPSYYVRRGNNLTIVAEVKSDNKLNITQTIWHKNNVQKSETKTLYIPNIEFTAGGRYRVESKTSLDRAHAVTRVIVQDRPGQVTDVLFVPSRDDLYEGVLSWVPPVENNSPVSEYKVEFEESRYQPGVWRFFKTIPGIESSSLIKTYSWTAQKFRVWAKNEIGWSLLPSKPSEPYRTEPRAPQINPEHLTTSGDSPSTMLVRWKPIDQLERNGPGFGYIIKWKNNETEESGRVLDGDEDSFTISNLTSYTDYVVSVQSFNDLGLGPTPSPITGFSGEDLPLEPPSNVRIIANENLPNKLQITWTPPEPLSVRGMIKHYKIKVNSTDSNGEVRTKEYFSPVYTLNYEIWNLDPYTKYDIAMAVVNGAGGGPFSKPIKAITPEGVPEAPSIYNAIPDITSLRVKWDVPDKPNGEILNYVVRYAESGAIRNFTRVKTNNTELEIVELSPAKEYVVYIQAETIKGLSEQSLVIRQSTKTPEGPQIKTFNITTDHSTANVSWFSSKIPYELGDYYAIEYKPRDKGIHSSWESTEKIPGGDLNVLYFFTVGNLRPDTKYNFRINAENVYGKTISRIITSSTKKVVGIASVGGTLTQIWVIIIIIVFLILLLVLALLICAICRRKRKGGKYSVSEKEKQLVQADMIPTNRNQDSVVGDKENNDTSPEEQKRRSVGGNSIEVFGSGDTRDYDENASFVGEYAPDSGNEEKDDNNEQTEHLLENGGDAV